LFIPNDGITEIVAHFIGYFEIRAEDCRYRPDFAEFSRQAQARPDEGDAHPRPLDFGNTLQLRTFVPEVAYVPAIQPIGPGSLTYSVAFDPGRRRAWPWRRRSLSAPARPSSSSRKSNI
jgi:hypothetical protein